ncbi:MAG: hypothetical protein KGL59_06995 [Acidobacteriota bacterium]|nr:hypothetical protein [Acidobacteriota bacterium]
MRVSNSYTAKRQKLAVGVSCLLEWLVLAALLSTLANASNHRPSDVGKQPTSRSMNWDPPNVNAHLKLVAPASACNLSGVLRQAGVRAEELEDNLSNFTADETIQYQFTGTTYEPRISRSGTFEYVAILTPMPWGASVQEARTPTKGTRPFPATAWDRGLPGLAFIFLPKLQAGYDMKCDGETNWKGQLSWVIHFEQRANAKGHTWSYTDSSGGVHVARMEGRAWVRAGSGEIVHLETVLLAAIPEMHIRNSWFSIDYGPVQFHSRPVRIWLPQFAASYTEFDDLDDHQMIIDHTFENFLLFSVKVGQQIKPPTQPH